MYNSPHKTTSVTFPTSSAYCLSKNKSEELISSSHKGYFHSNLMPLSSQWPDLYAGTWVTIWRALQHVTGLYHRQQMGETWKVQWVSEDSVPQAYNHSIQTYFKQKYMRSICHVSPSTTWCMTSLIMLVRSLLGDGAWKQEVGQGKDEDNMVGWIRTLPFIHPMESTCAHVVHC